MYVYMLLDAWIMCMFVWFLYELDVELDVYY
jgi:hypothetical protein